MSDLYNPPLQVVGLIATKRGDEDRGPLIWMRGDDASYRLVMEGELAVWHDWHGSAPVRLNTLGPGSYFGDIAILDRAPRSASVLATRPSRLLVLEGTLFRELILDRPEIAFEVFHVLAERLRAAEQRIAS